MLHVLSWTHCCLEKVSTWNRRISETCSSKKQGCSKDNDSCGTGQGAGLAPRVPTLLKLQLFLVLCDHGIVPAVYFPWSHPALRCSSGLLLSWLEFGSWDSCLSHVVLPWFSGRALWHLLSRSFALCSVSTGYCCSLWKSVQVQARGVAESEGMEHPGFGGSYK